MRIGDQIYQETNGINVYELVRQLFERLNSKKKSHLFLKEFIGYENNTLLILEFLYIISFDYGKDQFNEYVVPEYKMIISEKQYGELELLLIEKIKTQLKNKELDIHPNLGIILAEFKCFSQERNFDEYMPNIKTDEECLNFLKSFERNHYLEDNPDMLKTSLNFMDMEKLFKIENVKAKITGIFNKKDISDENKRYCERFIRDYENTYNFTIKRQESKFSPENNVTEDFKNYIKEEFLWKID